MGLKGMLIGGSIGSLFGGPLGAILGAVLGGQVEKTIARGRRANNSRKISAHYTDMSSNRRAMVFCASAAAMLAKMAKADGHVNRDEIAVVERAFVKLGFSRTARDYAVNVFRKAKDDSHTIFEYAMDFASAVESIEVRELFYEILWELAAADGSIGSDELLVLQRIPRGLGIRVEWYGYYFSRYAGGSSSGARRQVDPLKEAYDLLGMSPNDDTETLKHRYRELAKKNHPDALRAQGLPEEMIGKATERMSRINAAWVKIREQRGL